MPGPEVLKMKMVPSDPGDSVFSDRHARSELGIQNHRTLSPSLPSNAVQRLRLAAPENVSQQYW